MDISWDDIKEFGRIELVEENLNAFSYAELPIHKTKFYIFFTAIDADKKYVSLDAFKIMDAIQKKKIKLVHYLTGEEYTLGYVKENPHGDQFIASQLLNKNDVMIIEMTAGTFSGHAPISVVFKLSDGKIISTEYMGFSGFESRALIYQK